jgi:peptidoglycan/xylan/chitin deacetylase (PgdA/CDA1 family)
MVAAVRRRSSRYRHRRRPRRWLPAASLVAVVALVIVAAMAASGNSGSGGATGKASAAAPDRHRQRQSRHHGRQAEARRARIDDREVRAVLRYTPFVATGTRRHRLIALTFDDGPSPYTPAIVRILVRMRVPATFFVVGQQLQVFPSALRDELAHGFEIGDHTQNHAWLAHLNAAGQYAQIAAAAGGVQRLGAPPPMLFRPPYGIYDATTLATLRRLHMLMVLWSIDPGDWRRPGARAILANVLSHSKPGAIVILHDGGGDRSQTIAALPGIVRGLRRRGYRLVSVAQLIKLAPPPRHQQLPRLSAA